MKILIATGGSMESNPFFARAIREWGPEWVIAADSGLSHLRTLGIRPDVLLGDMDSVDPSLLETAKKEGIVPKVYPSHKDETDTELAISVAEEYGGKEAEIRLIGASGSRVDHTLPNLHLLCRIAPRGEIWDGRSRLWMRRGPWEEEVKIPSWFDPKKKVYVSFLPFGGEARGVTLRGFEYPLTAYRMEPHAAIGTSNELAEPSGTLSFTEGTLLCSMVQE